MHLDRLNELLARFADLHIGVVGDFFLDKYLVTDPALAERSAETGAPAHQVTGTRSMAGAAGTVTNNLATLGVQNIEAVGVIGLDGEGYELLRKLKSTHVDTHGLIASDTRFTPTRLHLLQSEADHERETETLDTRNRTPLPFDLETRILSVIDSLLTLDLDPSNSRTPVNAIIVFDQVAEANCGVITERARTRLVELAAKRREVVFFVDSRTQISRFRGFIAKPNAVELAAMHPGSTHGTEAAAREYAAEQAHELAARNGSPVYVTLGAEGMLVCTPDGALASVPAVPTEGTLDTSGAGDSATAGIVCALCAGATPEEAAIVGSLCAGVTIRKLGTTGVASPNEIRALLPLLPL